MWNLCTLRLFLAKIVFQPWTYDLQFEKFVQAIAQKL